MQSERTMLGGWFKGGWAMLLALANGVLWPWPGAVAQVVPDQSLGARSSRVQRDGLVEGRRSDVIRGGHQQGRNLFHSFSTFTIPAGQRVYFTPPTGVDRILARVTGTHRSEIYGTLGALGQADVFLINPNGILFGPDARLDLGGSFIASTASAVEFGDRGQFSTHPAQSHLSLLTIQPTALRLNAPPQPIVNRSLAADSSGVVGLQVAPGRSLLLVGGDVALEGGALTAAGGRVDLAATEGTVELATQGRGWRIASPGDRTQGEVLLRDSAVLVIGANAGQIALYGATIGVEDNSLILVGIGSRWGTQASQAGDITVDASGAIHIDNSTIANVIFQEGRGNSGEIRLRAETIVLQGAAQLETLNLSQGNAGDLQVTTGSLLLDAESRLLTRTYGRGHSGDILIQAQDGVILRDSDLFALVSGQGNVGDIAIQAGDGVVLDQSSLILNAIEPNATGRGGEISIRARSLALTQGAQIRSELLGSGAAGDIALTIDGPLQMDGVFGPGATDPTNRAFSSVIASIVFPSGQGQAGDIRVQADSLSITNGAFIFSRTEGRGDAGTIRLDIDRRLTLATSDPNRLISGISATVSETAFGNGGDVVIRADEVVMQDSLLTAASGGAGDAGNIQVEARTMLLDDAVVATTGVSGNGGNLTLRGLEVLLLDNGAIITAASALPGAEGNGGNVAIAADVIVADPRESNDIAANAEGGRGGNIDITAQAIVGIAPRPVRSPFTSDINASSRLSVDGTVTINTSVVDPIPATVNLPTVFSVPALAQGCQSQGDRSRFVITGRGGLPINPADPLVADRLWQDLGHTELETIPSPPPSEPLGHRSEAAPPLTEAQGWVVHPDGRIALLADAPTPMPYGVSRVTCDRP